MTKRLISFLLTLVLLIAIPLSARYRYNPYTRKLDYYEPASDVDLGDIGDITLTGLATGDILYYSGAAWVNLGVGANGEMLTLVAGIPSWAAAGAPAAHAASHEVGGADLVDHDQLTNWVANKHINWAAATDNFSTSEDFFLAWTEAADHAAITQTAVAGIEDQPLILIDDDRTGVTTNEAGEATLVIDAAGEHALYIADGAFTVADNPLRENLLTNSGFGVSSQSVLADIDAQINVTDITAGVCTTVDTQNLQNGDLVKFNGGGTTGTNVYEVSALITDTSFSIHDTTITDPANVDCDEATPGFIAADVYAPDTWTKTNTLDLYRWFNHPTYHKGMYAQQATKGVDTAEYLNAFGYIFDKDHHYLEYRGRTVTFGCWVYSVTAADNVKLQINDSDGTTESSFVAADSLIWVEITRTCGANITSFTPQFLLDGDTADVAYISHPMLIYGSSIGEGNYRPIPQEFIWLEKRILSNVYDNTANWGDVAFTDLNLEADSDAMLPKGAKMVAIHSAINDSGSGAGLDVHLQLRKNATADSFYCNSVAGKTNDVHSHESGIQPCDVNGDIDIHLDATGADTLDIEQFEYHGVQVN